MKRILFLLLLTATMISCTENQRAKNFGGTYKIDLPKGKKLVEATWKEDNLWFLTRDRREGEPIEVFTFQEDASWGLVEGKVIFREH